MAVEIIEAEEVPPRALMTLPEPQAGTLALAAMSDQEFATRLASLKKGRDRIATIQRELMDKDVDYGTIPGTPKPTLLKPGAEKLCDIYGFRADFLPERVIGDGVTAPALSYQTRCELHLGSLDGPVVAVGYGSANSWERKHRYRTGERACPDCGAIGTLLKSKREPEFFCWLKKGGCGKTFKLNDERITKQAVGDIENPDPWDLDTTLLKMAEKRAHVDATLRATAASGLFTQDVEDQARPVVDEPPPPDEPSIREVVEQRRSRTTRDVTEAQAGASTGSVQGQSSAEGAPAPTTKPDAPAVGSTPGEAGQCESKSPFDSESRCRREAGHTGVHKTSNESWPQ